MLKRKEFLNFRMANAQDANEPEDHTPPTASLTLSNGKKYDEISTSYQFDREVSDSTGTITVKALFNNADGVLLPGMFARVTMEGQPLKDAILVPQCAVQQVLAFLQITQAFNDDDIILVEAALDDIIAANLVA